MTTPAPDHPRPKYHAPVWLALLAVVLIAMNLRPGATSLGPVVQELETDLGISSTLSGLLTALPGLAFAIFGAFAITISVRLGINAALTLAVALAGIGLLIRAYAGNYPLFLAFTLVAFAGMAIGNVLVPAFVKKQFPSQLAFAMTVYTVALAIGATIPSALAAPISELLGGWRHSLALWGVTGLIAVLPWVAVFFVERKRPSELKAGSTSIFGVMRSRKAVALGIFFGAQSMQAYVQFGWAAQMYRDGGLSQGQAGLMASLIAAFGIPAGFIMPGLVAKLDNLRPVVWALGGLLFAGYFGIWLAPTTLPWLWAVMLGLSGFAFAMALALITARTRDSHVTVQVSAFTQSLGYLLAAVGPFLVGFLLELTGGWTVPLWFLMGMSVVMIGAGLVAAAPGYVDDELAA